MTCGARPLSPVPARREPYDADVIIVGAGPVGLVAAMDLDARGIPVILVEQRPFLQPPSVKCNHVAARTMERFRRLGVVAQVRAAGLPADYPHDVAFRTTLTGRELTRIPIPPSGERYTSAAGPDTRWATPEPPHRINQTFLEPLLARHVAGLPHVTLLNTTRYQGLTQDDNGVSVTITALDGGDRRVLRARFLIGADGGRSAVRKQIGASLEGDAVLQSVQSTCIRAPGLYDLMPAGGPGATTRTTAAAKDTSTPSTATRPSSCTTTSPPRRPRAAQRTGTGASAPSSAWTTASGTRSSARKTGWPVAWSPTGSATGGSSSPATRRTCGSRTAATA